MNAARLILEIAVTLVGVFALMTMGGGGVGVGVMLVASIALATHVTRRARRP